MGVELSKDVRDLHLTLGGTKQHDGHRSIRPTSICCETSVQGVRIIAGLFENTGNVRAAGFESPR
jgi:hypothetical protein